MAGVNMDAPKSDIPKLPDMVMCGDHPSFTKTELNVKTEMVDEKDKTKDKSLSYTKIMPTTSRTERPERLERGDRESCSWARGAAAAGAGAGAASAGSDHALRAGDARRRGRSLDPLQRTDLSLHDVGNRALVQAALGSFRWPPYLVCVWVLVLVLTHVLHCLVSMLDRALPALRKCSQLLRAWTEESWRGQGGGAEWRRQRVYPAALALGTALVYALYAALYAAHAAVLWATEPLGADDERRRDADAGLAALTDYDDDAPGLAPTGNT